MISPGDSVYYGGDSMGARANRRDVGTVGAARADGMMPVRWQHSPSDGWWVRADGVGRHSEGFTFWVWPSP